MTHNNQHIYFLGIGGIGMSALARYFKHSGYLVSGYDLTATSLTKQLQQEGIAVHYKEDTALIPTDATYVVYTPAIPKENLELQFCQKNNLPLIKRAVLLSQISQDYKTVAVAGTHGKTSISALIAHVLKNAEKSTTAFIGGITKNYHSNLVLSNNSECFVVEADEFDRSFLQLNPEIGIISSMDADHLDIYETHQALKEAFINFSNKIGPKGTLIYHIGLEKYFENKPQTISYGIESQADFQAINIRIENHQFVFDIKHKEISLSNIALMVPGKHYIENALAAAATGWKLGLTPNEIKDGIMTFNGVERRFDVRINQEKIVYIDDYAHHPNEIKVTIEAVKLLYPNKKILGIFQPHLYTRTRDFAQGFANELQKLDTVLLLDIYPAREKPIEGITANTILNQIKNKNKFLVNKKSLFEKLKTCEYDIVLTMGAGDIATLVTPLEKTLTL